MTAVRAVRAVKAVTAITTVKPTIQVSEESSRNRALASLACSARPVEYRARGRRGESLGSARDRQRLRERNAAERERVEEIVSSAAVPVERRAHRRESAILEPRPDSTLVRPRAVVGPQAVVRLHAVQPRHCPVCGDDKIVSDEVMHGGRLGVSECLHCEHRWTQRPKGRWAELGARMNRTGRSGSSRFPSDLGVNMGMKRA